MEMYKNWEFMQENPNNTFTYRCKKCNCAFSLPDLSEIYNYRYCPCCGGDMNE